MTHHSHFDEETTTDIRRKTSTALVEKMTITTNVGTLVVFVAASIAFLATLINGYNSLKTDVALVMQEVKALKVENEKLNDLVMQLYADKRVAKTHDKANNP